MNKPEPVEPGFMGTLRKLAAKNLSGSEDAILIRYIDELKAAYEREKERADEAQKNYQFMVERAADEKLDGYRELAAKVIANIERAEKSEAEVSRLNKALDAEEAEHAEHIAQAKFDLSKSEAENKRLQESWAKAAQMNDDQAARIGKLEAECAALRKDVTELTKTLQGFVFAADNSPFCSIAHLVEHGGTDVRGLVEKHSAAIKEQP